MSKRKKRAYMSNTRACLIIADWAAENDKDNYEYYRRVASRICYWYYIHTPTQWSDSINGSWRPWLRRDYPDIYNILWPSKEKGK